MSRGRPSLEEEQSSEEAHTTFMQLSQRKRRRRESRPMRRQRHHTSSSTALAAAMALLFLPSCYINNRGISIALATEPNYENVNSHDYMEEPWEDAYDNMEEPWEDAYDNMMEDTELWPDAESDVMNDNDTPDEKQQAIPPQADTADVDPPPLTPKKEQQQPGQEGEEDDDEEEDHHLTMEEELMLHAEHQINSQERIDRENSVNQKEHKEYQQFMDWCHQVMGIQTSVEIHTFYYYDYMTAIMMNSELADKDDDDDDDDDIQQEIDSDTPNSSTSDKNNNNNNNPEMEWQDPPMIPVRGLRATRNISQGEVIISLPFQALLTVSTTIDQDPVLSRVMGREARQAHGWALGQDNNSGENPEAMDSVNFFELPLLAMALLHHYKLGTSSPLYPYIHLLRKSPLDSMPFLWSKRKRRRQYGYPKAKSSVANGIQTVARSIRLEMKDMYHTVVDTLVKENPDLFGRRKKGHAQEYDTLDNEDWAFSYENFQWAFAMVNSRHWLLPVVDLESPSPAESPPAATPMHMKPQGSVDGVPPAEMPTEAWLEQLEEEEDEDEMEHVDEEPPQQQPNNNNNNPNLPSYHSFLAPVADLLNFGPPCTRGRYNQETHTFDIIASCDFTPGQEVTFWYSDECEEIIIGNYGFTHPMVPKCHTVEYYKLAKEKWKQRAVSLQEALEDAYEDMDVMDTELQHVQEVLADCDCCDKARDVRNASHRQKQGAELPTHAAPSQIRGGRGTMMMSRSSGRQRSGAGDGQDGNSNHSGGRSRGDTHSRSNPRGRGRPDGDVGSHGVRRMWEGRSQL